MSFLGGAGGAPRRRGPSSGASSHRSQLPACQPRRRGTSLEHPRRGASLTSACLPWGCTRARVASLRSCRARRRGRAFGGVARCRRAARGDRGTSGAWQAACGQDRVRGKAPSFAHFRGNRGVAGGSYSQPTARPDAPGGSATRSPGRAIDMAPRTPSSQHRRAAGAQTFIIPRRALRVRAVVAASDGRSRSSAARRLDDVDGGGGAPRAARRGF